MGKVIYGKKHGRWIEWHPNERKLDENYKHGLLDGTSTLFYKNGQREWRYTFNKNILDGIYTKWYRNGKRAVEGLFENGHPSGVWVWRNKLGEITKKKNTHPRKKMFLANTNSTFTDHLLNILPSTIHLIFTLTLNIYF